MQGPGLEGLDPDPPGVGAFLGWGILGWGVLQRAAATEQPGTPAF